jgi:hypothetical protein
MQCRTVRSKVDVPMEASLKGRNGSKGCSTAYARSAVRCRSMTWKMPTCAVLSNQGL